MIREHRFAGDARQVQRLVFTAEGDGSGMSIDLVPFELLNLHLIKKVRGQRSERYLQIISKLRHARDWYQ